MSVRTLRSLNSTMLLLRNFILKTTPFFNNFKLTIRKLDLGAVAETQSLNRAPWYKLIYSSENLMVRVVEEG